MKAPKKKLGEMLIEAGLIEEVQLRSALSYQEQWGGRLGTILLKKGFVSEQDIMNVLGSQLGLPCISLRDVQKPADEILTLVKVDIAKQFNIFPIRLEGKSLVIAVSDPTDLKMLDDISFMLGVKINPLLALESDIQRAIKIHYEGEVVLGSNIQIDRDNLDEIMKTVPAEAAVQKDEAPATNVRTDHRQTAKKAEISQKVVIESLIELLVRKNLITKEELMRLIKSKPKG